jgi:UrcA family protein
MTRTFQRSSVLLSAGLIAGLLLAATAARAADRTPTHDGIAVRYSPSELASGESTERLYRNLKLAALEVCGDGPTLRSLTERIQEKRCVEQVLANAVRKINQPVLTSLHESKISKVG